MYHFLKPAIISFSILFLIGCTSSLNDTTKERGSRTIRNGMTAAGQFLEVGLILYKGQLRCTGTLVRPTVVLTAAHCVTFVGSAGGSEDRRLKRVSPSDLEFKMDGIGSFLVTGFEYHPNYLPYRFFSRRPTDFGLAWIRQYDEQNDPAADIAILEIRRTDDVYLPNESFPLARIWREEFFLFANEDTAIVGYGKNQQNIHGKKLKGVTRLSGYLNGFALSTIDHNNKRAEFIPVEKASLIFHIDPDRNQNICRGDSGGPAYVNRNGSDFLIGVASRLNGVTSCAEGTISIHTNVADPLTANWLIPAIDSIDPFPPNAPKNLVAQAISPFEVRLTWDDNNDREDFFEVQMNRPIACPIEPCREPIFTTIGTISGDNILGSESFSHRPVTPGYEILYRVTAVRGTMRASEYAYVTVPLDGPPPAPTGVSAIPLSQQQIEIRWNFTGINPDRFKVIRRSAGGEIAIDGILRTNRNYIDSGLMANTSYSYVVRAINSLGESLDSNVAATVSLPSAPVIDSATVVSGTSIVINWSYQDSSISGFQIHRKIGSGSFQHIGQLRPATDRSFIDSGLPDGETVTYQMFAVNASGGLSIASNQISRVTPILPPQAPILTTVRAISPSQIQIDWTHSGRNVTQFIIERKIGSSSNYLPIRSDIAGTLRTYTDPNLSEQTEYSYRVIAVNDVSGPSSVSGQASAITPMLPPPAPTFVSLIPKSSSEVEVNWSHSGRNLSRFVLERREGTTGSFMSAEGSPYPANKFAVGDGRLKDGTTYFYRLRALNGTGESSPTIESSVTTPVAPPLAPVLSRITTHSASQITIEWTHAERHVSDFIIQRKVAGETDFTDAGTALHNSRSFSDSSLIDGTAYVYQVFARNEAGFSQASNSLSASTFPGIPVAPVLVSAAATSSSVIGIQWTHSGRNAEKYLIFRKLLPSGTYSKVGTVGKGSFLSFQSPGLAQNKTYTFKVVAVNSLNQNSMDSNELSDTTAVPAGAPTRLRTVSIANNLVVLTWDNNTTGELGFKIERRLGSTGVFNKLGENLRDQNQFYDSTVVPNNKYQYRVIPFNNVGNGRNTNRLQVKVPR